MPDGTASWAALAAILDPIDLTDSDISPREREYIVRAILAGSPEASEADVQAYMLDAGFGPVTGYPRPLTAEEFGVLVDKLRASTRNLPPDQRAKIRDAFLQGAEPVRPGTGR